MQDDLNSKQHESQDFLIKVFKTELINLKSIMRLTTLSQKEILNKLRFTKREIYLKAFKGQKVRLSQDDARIVYNLYLQNSTLDNPHPIEFIRRFYSLSQQELSEITGVSCSNISRIEKNQRGCSLQLAMNFCEKLNVNPFAFYKFMLAFEGLAQVTDSKKLA